MSEYAETTAKEQTTDQRARELPERIVIFSKVTLLAPSKE